ncbi:MAG: hypothetical protein ABW019_10970 [Chitinophagaceae bacterium]
MKYVAVVLLAVLLACGQPGRQPDAIPASDTISARPDTATGSVPAHTSHPVPLDTNNASLLRLAEKILGAIKQRNFEAFSSFVHPVAGVRFSPYAYIDTTRAKLLSAAQVLALARQNKIVTWGSYDASGEPIRMSIRKYVDRFVYDADFLHAKKKRVNEFVGYGNSLNNLKEVYPACDFVEFYFSGFDPHNDGMDWKTLRLVFRTGNGQPWLVAVVHDEWTI